jgi:hypothetical protein
VPGEANALADCWHEKTCKCRSFQERLMGFEPTTFCMASRTWTPERPKKSPAKCGFSELQAIGDASTFFREIAGVSGLKPDSGPCRLGRPVRSPTVGSHAVSRSALAAGRWCRCCCSSGWSSRPLRIGSLQCSLSNRVSCTVDAVALASYAGSVGVRELRNLGPGSARVRTVLR